MASGAAGGDSSRPPVRRRLARLLEPAVPRQYRRGAVQERRRVEGVPDPLEDADPRAAADGAACEGLLRCWVREKGVEEPAGDTLRLVLPASGAALRVPVRYWSATGWHRFGRPRLHGAPADSPPLDAVTLASLLGREAAYAAGGTCITEDGADLVGRVADSVRRTADFVASRRARPADTGPGSPTTAAAAVTAAASPTAPDDRAPSTAPAPTAEPAAPTAADAAAGQADKPTLRTSAAAPATPRTDTPSDSHRFLTAEQNLVLGHPLHPTPKSREGLSDAEVRAYSPELRGAFPLHWFAVHRDILATDSAWTERGKTIPAPELAHRLAGEGLKVPEGCVPLPLHPWQAREVAARGPVAELLGAGLLHDLGAYGAPWHPTSSVRTVCRPGSPAMLKLSLGLRITNSRRENLRKELQRGTEVHRLLRAGLGEEWRKAVAAASRPGGKGFDIVRDPAWLAVDTADGMPITGLDAVIRHQPFAADDDALCIAALTSPQPAPSRRGMRSRLQDVIERLAERTGRPTAAVSAEWFLRYLETVVRPILWLDAHAGVALEAHQQNTLVILDADGWPAGGRYRDNQGYYLRTSHREALQRRLPGIGEESDSYVTDEVTDERFAYYLGINNILGLIGAFGSTGLCGERVLLAACRRFLTEAAAPAEPGEPVSPLPARLLETATIRCKANLLTRLHGLDELVGPVDTQSVYVTITNPLAA
ncbi:IucA/IucC family protein [Streptomyces boninensis]|uniref:IucA/IucC family protein n=1 Tax=Streptomyces boninensis TaxID=2039455 RepID=UPI003B21FB66